MTTTNPTDPGPTEPAWVTIAIPGQPPITCAAEAVGAVLRDQLLSDEVRKLLHHIHALHVAAEDGRDYAGMRPPWACA